MGRKRVTKLKKKKKGMKGKERRWEGREGTREGGRNKLLNYNKGSEVRGKRCVKTAGRRGKKGKIKDRADNDGRETIGRKMINKRNKRDDAGREKYRGRDGERGGGKREKVVEQGGRQHGRREEGREGKEREREIHFSPQLLSDTVVFPSLLINAPQCPCLPLPRPLAIGCARLPKGVAGEGGGIQCLGGLHVKTGRG